MTEERKSEIAANYRVITERLKKAEETRPANSGTVRVLAATKHVPPEEIAFAVRELGITLAGENRTDELLSKLSDEIMPYSGAELHFIGTLQTRKVRDIAGRVSMIESVDGLRLADEISKRSAALDIKTRVLVEINSGREPNKSGVMPEEFDALADEITAMDGLILCGGMTMGPRDANFNEYCKIFKETYNKILDFFAKKTHNIKESNILGFNAPNTDYHPVVSMGMSDSYEAAAAAGATIVRIGSALFGARR